MQIIRLLQIRAKNAEAVRPAENRGERRDERKKWLSFDRKYERKETAMTEGTKERGHGPEPERTEEERLPRGGEERTEAGRSPFPHVGDLLALLGIFLVANVIGGFVAALVGAVPFDHLGSMTPDETGRLLAIGGVVTYLLAFGGMLVYRRARGARGRFVRFSLRGLDPGLLLWGLVFLLAAGVVLEPLLGLLPPAPTAQTYGTGVWTVLAVVFFAPFFEELICRGLVLESLRSRYGVLAAWLGSSLFFGVIHLQPQLAVNAFFVGLILAYIYLRADSVWPVMLLHAVNNAIAYVALALGADSVMLSELIVDRTLYLTVYGISAVICIVSGVMVARSLRRSGTSVPTGKEDSGV